MPEEAKEEIKQETNDESKMEIVSFEVKEIEAIKNEIHELCIGVKSAD